MAFLLDVYDSITDGITRLKKVARPLLKLFMSNSVTTGELRETGCSLNVEWEIPNISSLSDDVVDKLYHSPVFYFMDATWYLRFCPNGETEYKSEGYVGVFLMREDAGPPKSVTYRLYLRRNLPEATDDQSYYRRRADSSTEEVSQGTHSFESGKGWGVAKYMERSNFFNKKKNLAKGDVVTVCCSLKNDDSRISRNSLLGRLLSISESMKRIFLDGKETNVVLKVGEQEFLAHKVILESRSPVFAAMFNHDMQEQRTGVVDIRDIDADALKATLTYMYSGTVDSIDCKNVFQIYKAADKYDLDELKQLCREFMEKKLCDEFVCDVIGFARLYNEEELGRLAREYFNMNAKKIIKTECWEIFYRQNVKLAMELVATVIDHRS